jgi:hypothetical protein
MCDEGLRRRSREGREGEGESKRGEMIRRGEGRR